MSSGRFPLLRRTRPLPSFSRISDKAAHEIDDLVLEQDQGICRDQQALHPHSRFAPHGMHTPRPADQEQDEKQRIERHDAVHQGRVAGRQRVVKLVPVGPGNQVYHGKSGLRAALAVSAPIVPYGG